MNAYPFAVVGAEHLADVASAYSAWQGALDRDKAARIVFRAAVSDARDAGAKLDAIAAQLGVTRQAIQKVLREVRREQDEQEAEARYFEREAEKDLTAQMRGLGFTAADRQCGVCRRFKSAPSAVCDYCGDDPVTHNGERRDFDAAYSGGIR